MTGMGDGVSGRSAASGMRRAIAEVGPLGIRVRKPVPQLLPIRAIVVPASMLLESAKND